MDTVEKLSAALLAILFVGTVAVVIAAGVTVGLHGQRQEQRIRQLEWELYNSREHVKALKAEETRRMAAWVRE